MEQGWLDRVAETLRSGLLVGSEANVQTLGADLGFGDFWLERATVQCTATQLRNCQVSALVRDSVWQRRMHGEILNGCIHLWHRCRLNDQSQTWMHQYCLAYLKDRKGR